MPLTVIRGFSLVEVTVAVAIIGMMAVATGTLLQHIPVGSREVRDQDVALRIARNEVEVLRAAGYTTLPPSGAIANTLLGSLVSSSASAAITDFNEKTKRVDVSVYWRGANLAARSVTLTTLVTESSTLK